MTTHRPSIIEHLAGVQPGSALDAVLAARPDARLNAQTSHDLLIHPVDPGPVSLLERHAVAAFVAALQGQAESAAHYRTLLEASAPDGRLSHAVLWAADQAATSGPYGRFPHGPLSEEDRDGPVFAASDELHDLVGARLSAALEHAHLLVFHPRDASPDALQKLLDAGWTTAGIVVLSQLVAFLSFQARVVAGLRAVIAAKQTQSRVAVSA